MELQSLVSGLRKSGMNIINEALLNNFLPLDPTVAFDFDLFRDENNDPFSSIGALEDMYIKHTWSSSIHLRQ